MGNHNSGRRPSPTSLKVLRGNPSKTRLNEAEPRPPAGEVVKPGVLSAGAGAVWDELAPICLAMKTLTVADVRPFLTMCELAATFDRTVATKGELEGYDTRLERDTAVALRPYFALFGLEPISRAKISVPKTPDAPASKWEGFIK